MNNRNAKDKGMMTRRDLLITLAGMGAGLMGRNAFGAPAAAIQRKIPRTGEMLPAVGLGTYDAFDVGSSERERAPVREVLRLFVEMGGAVIDTSPMYGSAEKVIGDLAADLNVQKSLFVATKVWTRGRQAGIDQMKTSMKLLHSNRIDVMQVHNLVDWKTHLKTLRGWKEKGTIRYIGITHYTESAYDDLERIMKVEELDFVQLNYSIGAREAEKRLLPLAADRGVAVIANRPFQKAALFRRVRGTRLPSWTADFDCSSWAQFFLKFILSHRAITCAIPATSNPKHLKDNMEAGRGKLPDAKRRKKMVEFMQRL